MQTRKRLFLAASTLIATFALTSVGHAAIITSSLGNTSSGFNDGDILTAAQVGAALGPPAPFNASIGSDNLAFLGTFDAAWQHTFAAIADPIASATLTFGIWEHDSSASGSQVGSFSLDAQDETATLDALFETPGHGQQIYNQGSEFNVYTLDLISLGLAASLADGALDAALRLQGPALIDNLTLGVVEEVDVGTNGAALLFSTLTIETRNGEVPVPDPATLSLALLAFGTLLWRRREHALTAIRRR
jgi:hypothetical protein